MISICPSQYNHDYQVSFGRRRPHNLTTYCKIFSFQKMLHKNYSYKLLIFFVVFKPNRADLKSCSENHEKLDICFKGHEYYKYPFPAVVRSDLHLNEIIEIDEDKNSVSAQVYLWMGWHDGLLFLSNSSTAMYEKFLDA